MNNAEKGILTYLENSFSGAKMMGDEDCQVRLARAIAAFKTDPDVDALVYFTERFFIENITK